MCAKLRKFPMSLIFQDMEVWDDVMAQVSMPFIHFSLQVAPLDISILAACASDFYCSFYRAAKLRSEGVGCKQEKTSYVCMCLQWKSFP